MLRQVIFIIDSNRQQTEDHCRAALMHLAKDGIGGSILPVKDVSVQTLPRKEALMITDDPGMLQRLLSASCAAIALRDAHNRASSFDGAAYIFEDPQDIDTDSYIKAYQRLAHIPWDILTTKRLRIRETTVDDVDAFYRIYRDPAMTRYMEGLFEDPADEKRYMEDYIKNVYALLGFGIWTVIENKTGDIVGRCGFSVRGGFDLVEIGFLIGTPWQGRGYATEAVSAVLSYGKEKLQLDAVQALVREGNDVSAHLLEKAGFRTMRTIDVEEDIYGGVYPGLGKGRLVLSPARCGRYLEMVKTPL